MFSIKRRKKYTTVSDMLKHMDGDTFMVLIKNSKASNMFNGKELPDILNWKFCDVERLGKLNIVECLNTALKEYAGINESDISMGKASEYISLLRHVKNEFEKVSKLFDQLEREPDADMINSGIDKMNNFGVLGIYYAIDKNPTKWDEISETPFGLMYSKLMMDKVSGDIQENYNKIQSDKAKHRSR